MKNVIFCIIVFLNVNVYSQCLPDGIIFQNQAEIDQFPSLYPLCQTIEGDVIIDATTQFAINNLDSLESIIAIQGNLKIHTNSISDLMGLHNLIFVGGQLEITYNHNLDNLVGLSELLNIGSNLIIKNNNDLINLTGLESLVNIGGDFIVKNNNSFITPVGTINLNRVGGNLDIHTDLSQQTSGLENLNFIGGDFMSDVSSTSLTNFIGYENLDTIIGSFVFGSFNDLESYQGFDNLKYIGGDLDFSFTDIDSFRLSDFPILNQIGGDLHFGSSSNLKSIKGLNNLEKIGGDLRFLSMSQLREISGFESLTVIDSLFTIERCRYLITIPEFNNLVHCGGIFIGELEDTSGDANEDLSSIVGFESLLTVENDLLIGHNKALELIDAFNALTHVGGDLGLIRNSFGTSDSIRVFNSIQEVGGNYFLNEQYYVFNPMNDFLSYVGGDLMIRGISAASLSFPSLERVEGHFIVENGWELDSLSELSNLRYIGGNFILDELSNLVHLDDCLLLDSIGGDFILSDNNNLQVVSGFDQLSYIGGSFIIRDHENFSDTSLTTIPNFNSLVHIGESMSITSNDHLLSVNGFNNLSKVNNLAIIYNGQLQEIYGFNLLQKVNGSLRLENSNVDSLNAFHQLDSIFTYFSFNGAEYFVGFEDLEYVAQSMSIKNINLDPTNQFNQLVYIGSSLTADQLFADDIINIFNEVIQIGGRIELSRIQCQTINLLENVNNINGRLEIEENNFTTLNGLNTITHINEGFYLSDNEGQSQINGFNNLNTIGTNFTCRNNSGPISFQFLNQLTSIGSNVIINNNDSLFTFNGLNNLSNINGSLTIENHYRLTEVSALSNLQSINGSLIIDDNVSLKSLIGLENIDPTTIKSNSSNPFIDDLKIFSNDSLSMCSIESICEYLILPNTQTTIALNYDGCDSPEELMCLNSILSGIIFYDNNQNGIKDSVDFGLENRSIELQPENIIIYTNEIGQYYEFADSGSLQIINYNEHPDWVLTSDSITYTHNFVPGQPENLSNDFGVYPTFSGNFGEIFTMSNPTRCNTDVQFYIKMKNVGTYFESGNLIMQIDSICDFIEAFPPPNTVDLSTNTISWTRDSIAPFQTFEPIVTLAMPDETFTGDSLLFTSTWNSTNSSLSVYDTYESEVRCSYDPNDKLAMPAGVYDENYALLTDTFEYTIRFQNTGNDVAIDVAIFDTISTQFDINSFKVLNSSHSVEVRRINNAIEFLFNEIYLPDSISNEIGSHGFVSYQIVPIEDTPNNSLVENTAYIVFDFNPAIVTNTTLHTLVDSIPNLVDEDNDGFYNNVDCDDNNPNIYPGNEEIIYDGLDNDCDDNTLDDDLDQDGSPLSEDCDDSNPFVNFNNEEIQYDGIDNDCNPSTLDDDLDQDGFLLADDCDDNNFDVNPNSQEVPYDGVDNDCNTATLDDDLDQDGFVLADDCDDSNFDINPDSQEIPYDSLDNDCNIATLDDDLDQDGFLLADDCDDTNFDINPDGEEIPNNGIDEDCDESDLIIGINELSGRIIQFFPNPVRQKLTITLTGQSNSELEIKLYDIKGQMISNNIYRNSEVTIDMLELQNGLYLLEIVDLETGESIVEKIEKFK